MLVRFFAGFDLDTSKSSSPDLIEYLYSNGFSMGSDVDQLSQNKNLNFFVWAMRDSDSAPLQRIQIIKGWIANGQTYEKVFDIACSDGLEVDPVTNRCPDNKAMVNLADCSFSEDKGDNEIMSFGKILNSIPNRELFIMSEY